MSSFTRLLRKVPLARSCGLAFAGETCAAVVIARTLLETYEESRFVHSDPDPAIAAAHVLELVRGRYGELPPLAAGLPAGSAYFELKSTEAEQIPADAATQDDLVGLLPPSLADLPVRVEAMAEGLAGESMLAVWAARAETIERLLAPLGAARRHVERLVPQPLALATLLADLQPADAAKLAIHVLVGVDVVLCLVSCERTLVAWHQLVAEDGASREGMIEAALRVGERRARQAVGPGRLLSATVYLPGPGGEDLAPRLSAALGFDVPVREAEWFDAGTLASGQAQVALRHSPCAGSLMPRIVASARERKPFRAMVRWSEATTLAGLAAVAVLLANLQAAELGGRLRILEGRMPAWAAGKSGADLSAQEKQLNARLAQIEEFFGRDEPRWTRALELMTGALLPDARLHRVELEPEAISGARKAAPTGRLVLNMEVEAPDEIKTAAALRASRPFHQRFPAVQVTRLKAPEDGRSGTRKVPSFEIRACESGPPPAPPSGKRDAPKPR